jgi:hypothetical protein
MKMWLDYLRLQITSEQSASSQHTLSKHPVEVT